VLIMGAACFYLYTRIKQVEKKLTLVEGILLDLKTATEATFMDFPAATSYLLAKDLGAEEDDDSDFIPEVHNSSNEDSGISAFKDDNDIEELGPVIHEDYEAEGEGEEEEEKPAIQVNKIVETVTTVPDLELLNVKELMAIARSKGLTISKTMRKQQIIDAINASAALPVMTTATIDENSGDVDGTIAESTFINGTTLDSSPF
jgi:hypothetical protein